MGEKFRQGRFPVGSRDRHDLAFPEQRREIDFSEANRPHRFRGGEPFVARGKPGGEHDERMPGRRLAVKRRRSSIGATLVVEHALGPHTLKQLAHGQSAAAATEYGSGAPQ